MKLSDQNILFLSRSTQHGGAENVILQLCEILGPRVKKIVICAGAGFDSNDLQDKGIKYYTIPDIEKKSFRTIIAVSKILNQVVKKENITVIHTHHRMAAFYVSFLGLYKNRVFINTSHNTFTDKVKLTRFSYKHAHLIACGEMVKKNLIDVYGLQNVTVIHNAVKPFEGPIVNDPLITKLHEEGCIVIGNIGRLSEQKGFIYFIDAIPGVISKYFNARFLIVGSGEDEKKLKKQVSDLGLDKEVFFMGFRRDIQNLMSQMDFIVLSSLWEGLPLTPIEAFSVGKFAVATAVDGTTEIVKDGVNGYLVPAKDFKALSIAISKAIDADRTKLEVEARRTFLEEFSFDVFSNAIIKYYEGL